MFGAMEKVMGTPADYTILVLLIAVAVGVWTALDKINQLQREVEALKKKSEPRDQA